MTNKANINGLNFEKDTDLRTILSENNHGHIMSGDLILNEDGTPYARLCRKHSLYKFLREEFGINPSVRISKKLLPDEAMYFYETKTLLIIEKKFQEVVGSADEKPRACDFMKWIYSRLVADAGVKVEMVYLFNDWFKKPEYADLLLYMRDHNVRCYFNEIPMNELWR